MITIVSYIAFLVAFFVATVSIYVTLLKIELI